MIKAIGNHRVTFEQLSHVTPERRSTNSYTVVSHKDIAVWLKEVGRTMLKGYEFTGEQYILSRYGKRMFGVHSYHSDIINNFRLDLAIGFRNSYDKQIGVSILAGGIVMAGHNPIFFGRTKKSQKHSPHAWRGVNRLARMTMLKGERKFDKILSDARQMRDISLSNVQAYETLGILAGHGCLSPRQFEQARKMWKEPAYREFVPHNLWSLYNNCTEALKTTSVERRIDRHCRLHKCIEFYHLGYIQKIYA